MINKINPRQYFCLQYFDSILSATTFRKTLHRNCNILFLFAMIAIPILYASSMVAFYCLKLHPSCYKSLSYILIVGKSRCIHACKLLLIYMYISAIYKRTSRDINNKCYLCLSNQSSLHKWELRLASSLFKNSESR